MLSAAILALIGLRAEEKKKKRFIDITFVSASQAKFTIVASTGEVSLKSGEALSAGPKLIAVTAVDKGSPKRTGTGTVVVCVAMKCCQTGCCPLPPERKQIILFYNKSFVQDIFDIHKFLYCSAVAQV